MRFTRLGSRDAIRNRGGFRLFGFIAIRHTFRFVLVLWIDDGGDLFGSGFDVIVRGAKLLFVRGADRFSCPQESEGRIGDLHTDGLTCQHLSGDGQKRCRLAGVELRQCPSESGIVQYREEDIERRNGRRSWAKTSAVIERNPSLLAERLVAVKPRERIEIHE